MIDRVIGSVSGRRIENSFMASTNKRSLYILKYLFRLTGVVRCESRVFQNNDAAWADSVGTCLKWDSFAWACNVKRAGE